MFGWFAKRAHDRARSVLGAYGAAPSRWPAGERAGVIKGATSDLTVAIEQRREAALDRLLDSAPRHMPSPALMARIRLAATVAPQSGWRAAWDALFGDLTQASVMRAASALTAAMILGVSLGIWWTPADDATDMTDEYVTLAFALDWQSTDDITESAAP